MVKNLLRIINLNQLSYIMHRDMDQQQTYFRYEGRNETEDFEFYQQYVIRYSETGLVKRRIYSYRDPYLAYKHETNHVPALTN